MTVNFFNLLQVMAIVVVAASTAFAGTPADYYSTADDSSPATLRTTLNDIVTSNHVTIDFGTQSGNSAASFNALKVADEDLVDTSSVRLIYSKDTRPKSADHNQDSNPATGGWNREHAWPQSFYDMDISGDGDRPMVDDLHSLFSCDADINNTGRNDKEYDYVTTPTITTDVFGDKWNSSRFEPRDISKGDAARAIFYMDVRFEGETTEPNLVLQNTAVAGTGSARMAFLNTLLQWHLLDPPDAFERIRNNRVHNLQKNSNPFIDHPELVEKIYGGTAWSFEDGTTVSVSTTDRAPYSALPTATNIPMLSLALGVEGKEWHLQDLLISQTGTATDAEITEVALWHDVDNDGIATAVDSKLATSTVISANAVFSPDDPFFVATGTMNLLITATPSPSTVDGHTIQLSLNDGALAHSPSGGNDVDPTFASVLTNDTIITPAGILVSQFSNVSQTLDSIGTAGAATLPAHWKVDKQAVVRTVGTWEAAVTATDFAGGTSLSSSATNGIYNFGDTDSSSDRAIGFLSSGSATKSGNLYVKLTNADARALDKLEISYDVEKYRNGTNAAGFRVQLYYSLDGTNWTSAGANFLTTFAANADSNGFANAPGVVSAVSAQILPVAVPSGSSIFLAWNYSVATGSTTSNAQALAIDNLVLFTTVPVTLSGFEVE